MSGYSVFCGSMYSYSVIFGVCIVTVCIVTLCIVAVHMFAAGIVAVCISVYNCNFYS